MKTIEYLMFLFPLILHAQFVKIKTITVGLEIDSDTSFTYKIIDETKLNLWVFNPSKRYNSDSRPAIIFFFGGGFRGEHPNNF